MSRYKILKYISFDDWQRTFSSPNRLKKNWRLVALNSIGEDINFLA
jgi:hypothetical protein